MTGQTNPNERITLQSASDILQAQKDNDRNKQEAEKISFEQKALEIFEAFIGRVSQHIQKDSTPSLSVMGLAAEHLPDGLQVGVIAGKGGEPECKGKCCSLMGVAHAVYKLLIAGRFDVFITTTFDDGGKPIVALIADWQNANMKLSKTN